MDVSFGIVNRNQISIAYSRAKKNYHCLQSQPVPQSLNYKYKQSFEERCHNGISDEEKGVLSDTTEKAVQTQKCSSKKCLLCKSGVSQYLGRNPKWEQVVMFIIHILEQMKSLSPSSDQVIKSFEDHIQIFKSLELNPSIEECKLQEQIKRVIQELDLNMNSQKKNKVSSDIVQKTGGSKKQKLSIDIVPPTGGSNITLPSMKYFEVPSMQYFEVPSMQYAKDVNPLSKEFETYLKNRQTYPQIPPAQLTSVQIAVSNVHLPKLNIKLLESSNF